MKYLILLLVLLSVFASCKTPNLTTKTIIKDSIVYRDTSVILHNVPVPIKADTVTLHDTIPGLPKNLEASNSKTTGHKTTSYEIKDGQIKVECHDDAYIATIDSLKLLLKNKEQYHSEVTTQQIPVEVIKYRTPTWIKWLFGIVAAGGLVFLGVKGYLSSFFGVVGTIFGKLGGLFKKK